MTKREYSHLSVDELVHNQEFIKIVSTNFSENEWKQLLEANFANRENILRAKEIINTFKTTEAKLDNNRKNTLWNKIESFSTGNSNKKRISILPRIIRVAASITLILAFGALAFYISEFNTSQYQFSEIAVNEDNKNSLLVLSTGETVELKNDQSTIVVLDKKETIQIDNDTIIKNNSTQKVVKKQEVRLTEVIVPFGKKTILTLNDGTKVWLNAGSRFAFPQKFDNKHRTVFLDGEGYFEVAKNVNKPFIVSSENLNIEVLGTKFNVSSYTTDNYCETVLLEGSVKVWGRNKLVNERVVMSPNQVGTYNLTQKEMILHEDANPEKFVSWINGWYEFNNVELVKVLTKLERYYDIEFSYDKEFISKALPISGKLDLKDSIDDVMSVLARVAEVNYEFKDQQIFIKH